MLFSPETFAIILLAFAAYALMDQLWTPASPAGAEARLKGVVSQVTNTVMGLLVQAWALTVLGAAVWVAFFVVLYATLAVAIVKQLRERRSA